MAFRDEKIKAAGALRFAVYFRDEKLKRLLVAELVREYGGHFEGFYTEELLKDGKRSGYLLKTLSGESAVLASRELFSPVSFNKYALDVSALDGPAAAAVARALELKRPLFMDELGSMMLKSEKFSAALVRATREGLPMAVFMRGGGAAFGKTFSVLDGVFETDLDADGYGAVMESFRAWAGPGIIEKREVK